MSKITLIHPSRGRAEQAKAAFNRWAEKSREKDFEYILSIDIDDPERDKYLECGPALMGNNRSVVDAVNNAAQKATGDIIVVMSDDFDCPQDWDKLIIKAAEKHNSRYAWAMKTDDGAQPWIITLPIVSRGWYDTFGYIYQPDYRHMFCDTDMTTVAHFMDVTIDARHLHFPHNHYSTGKTEMDALNQRNDNTWNQGQAVYLERFANDFYLPGHWVKQRLNPADKHTADHISWLVRMGVRNV